MTPKLPFFSFPRSVLARASRESRRSFRSEEHTSELQSHSDLVCRLLLEKKKNKLHDRYLSLDKFIDHITLTTDPTRSVQKRDVRRMLLTALHGFTERTIVYESSDV